MCHGGLSFVRYLKAKTPPKPKKGQEKTFYIFRVNTQTMPKVLVLCIDRDNDIGRKAGNAGPVIGRKANLELAVALAIADPQDTDANVIFEGIRQFDALSKEEDTEIATVAGDVEVGVKSDKRIAEQLSYVIAKTGADRVLLVSDGAEDEQILPIVQGYARVLSVRRLVVNQSEKLEGMYYAIHGFMRRTIEDRRMARLYLGLPAIVFLIYAVFGTTGWRLMLGAMGVYLFVKGFQLESIVSSLLAELKLTFVAKRNSFFLYIVSMAMAVISLRTGYTAMTTISPASLLERTAAFVNGSVYTLFLSASIALAGKAWSSQPVKKRLLRYFPVFTLFLAIAVVGFEASLLLLSPQSGFWRLYAAIGVGLVLASITLTRDRIFKK